jgi:hypothetical protein
MPGGMYSSFKLKWMKIKVNFCFGRMFEEIWPPGENIVF